MLSVSDAIIVGVMFFSCVLLGISLRYVLIRKEKKQLDKIFIIIFGLLIFWLLCEILQIIFVSIFHINQLYFDYFSYISVSFLPVMVLLMSLIFARTKLNFKKSYLLLFVTSFILCNIF